MPHFLKTASQIQAIIALRSIAIIIQLLLILFVNLALEYQLPWTPLFSVIALELIFTFASSIFFTKISTSLTKKVVNILY